MSKDPLLTPLHMELLALLGYTGLLRGSAYRLDNPELYNLRRLVRYKGNEMEPLERLTHEFYYCESCEKGVILAIKSPERLIYHASVAAYRHAADGKLVSQYVLHHKDVAVYYIHKESDDEHTTGDKGNHD